MGTGKWMGSRGNYAVGGKEEERVRAGRKEGRRGEEKMLLKVRRRKNLD